MKPKTEQNLSRWLPVIINLLIGAIYIGIIYGKVQNHIEDASVHMPFERKIEVFVPRTEIEGNIDHLRQDVQDVKEMVRKIYERGQ